MSDLSFIEFIQEFSHEAIEDWFEAQKDMMNMKMETLGDEFEEFIS